MNQATVCSDTDMAAKNTTEICVKEGPYYVPDGATRRSLGAYYTSATAADYMAEWLVRHEGEHILEPSFGDGIFVKAVAAKAKRNGFDSLPVSGVEIDARVGAQTCSNFPCVKFDIQYCDFLAVAPFKVQAAIGNPPYVRLRHLPDDQRKRALRAAEAAMAEVMDPAGSLWMPFLLHTMRFLEVGGRMAFVLPYEFTYVRYALPLWDSLRRNFGSLRILRTHERLFPDLAQEVVILLADDFGSPTNEVQFQAFERAHDLLCERPVINERLDVEALLQGERAFVRALLGSDLRHLLDTRVNTMTAPAREMVTFNIGYVAGDKTFFHPATETRCAFELPDRNLFPSLTSTRMLKGRGLRTAPENIRNMDTLFLPDPNNLTEGEQNYISFGEERGVSERFKCRVRSPWFMVPGVKVPDVILSVFSECPVLLVNDGKCFASNSLLCGYSKGVSGEEIAARWYTSLTLLQCELEVHALGGGVMVMVPREAGNIRLPNPVCVPLEHLNEVDRLLRRGKTTEAYRLGDRAILTGSLKLGENDIDAIIHGRNLLAHWRTSSRPV